MTSEPQIEELSEDALGLLSKTCKARACVWIAFIPGDHAEQVAAARARKERAA